MTTYVLVSGLWLGGWAWHDVTAALRGAGHEVFPLTLTGVADRSHLLGPGVDLDTHIEDIVRLVEIEDLRDVVLVGHSYGGMPVSAAALRLRDRIARVIYVESGPPPVGASQQSMSGEPAGDGDAVPPREWDAAADPVLLAGLDEAALNLLRTRSTPHPRASVIQPLGARATSEDLPTTLVACTFPADQIKEMMAAGHPFFSGLTEAEVVVLPTGHWPMLSEPAALAGILEQRG
ncbi:alpha/beta fold hydrolase [Actinoplanes sp. NPDC049599]|uniref:alpha/beta fold hydrolase n=1 Tax=Actinoplanes sp. NPDC049599 TaxID=3363903 RepID=UPI00379500CB